MNPMFEDITITRKEFYDLVNMINEDETPLSAEVKAIFQEWQDRFRIRKYSQSEIDEKNKKQQDYIKEVFEETSKFKNMLDEIMPDGSPRFQRLTKEEAEKRYLVLTEEETRKFLQIPLDNI